MELHHHLVVLPVISHRARVNHERLPRKAPTTPSRHAQNGAHPAPNRSPTLSQEVSAPERRNHRANQSKQKSGQKPTLKAGYHQKDTAGKVSPTPCNRYWPPTSLMQ